MDSKVKYLTDRESELEALALSIINRKHWTHHRVDELPEWKGVRLAKRTEAKFKIYY